VKFRDRRNFEKIHICDERFIRLKSSLSFESFTSILELSRKSFSFYLISLKLCNHQTNSSQEILEREGNSVILEVNHEWFNRSNQFIHLYISLLMSQDALEND